MLISKSHAITSTRESMMRSWIRFRPMYRGLLLCVCYANVFGMYGIYIVHVSAIVATIKTLVSFT